MGAEIQGGATLWARQTIDSEIFTDKPDKWFKIWFYLVNRASHTETKQFKRGECFIQYEWIAEKTKATPDQIKKCIAWLRETGAVSTARSTRGVTVFLPKYSHYQRLDNYYSDVKAPHEAPEKHQRSTREAPRYNKNDKNLKNDNNIGNLPVAGIDDIMNIFYKINPTLNWGNKTTRSAAEFMIKKFGLEETKRMAEQVVMVQGKEFSPTCTTPHQMKEKLAQFKIYFDKQKNNKHNLIRV